MTPLEVAHRVARAAQARAERWQEPREVPAAFSFEERIFIEKREGIDAAPYLHAADRIAEGWLDVFALRRFDLGSPPRWNRDPKTGVEAPLAFGKLLDYRDPDLVGDIKYLWEPNRHLHLVTLAQAFALSGDAKYFEALADQLDSWFLACPYPLGPNWSSALEAAIRLINWSIAWQLVLPLIEKTENLEFRNRWLRSIYQHCRFVRGWFSRHSSANNHLIGEAAGLYVAALAWPAWPESAGWRRAAKAILEKEALAQNAPDGVNREQAVSYQQFVFDFLLVALLAGRAAREEFSPAYRQRLEAMLDFVCSIMDAGGNVPMIGDADDGYVFRLDVKDEHSPFKSLLATGAVLFGRGDFKQKAGGLDDKTRWLLGRDAEARYEALDAERTALPQRRQFGEGGYYVLGCELDTPAEIRIVADAGPLGYRSIAAHGHADALSFTLSAGGQEFLVDPGTYAYHTQARWRAYFRGTAAHNTVRVDGLDQSEPGGNFMWMKHARAGCSLWLSTALKDCFEGWHDGYMRLPDPVKHRRLIELDKAERRVVVEDTLEMAEEHAVELVFHCAEQCSVEPDGELAFVVSRPGGSVRLVLPRADGAIATAYAGSLSPIFGWVSRAFDQRVPAPTIVWRARLAAGVTLRSEILVG